MPEHDTDRLQGQTVNKRDDTLCKATLRLIQTRVVSIKLTDIANATGVPMSWLSRFQNNKLHAPAADNVQKVYEYLTGRQLEY